MNKLCKTLNFKNEDLLFDKITKSFKEKITKWDYFVNWEKVLINVELFEKELNILNFLIGKPNLKEEAFKLIKEYPHIIRAIPTLLAVREGAIEILIDSKNFTYKYLDFFNVACDEDEINDYVDFIINTGLGEIISDKKIKNSNI